MSIGMKNVYILPAQEVCHASQKKGGCQENSGGQEKSGC